MQRKRGLVLIAIIPLCLVGQFVFAATGAAHVKRPARHARHHHAHSSAEPELRSSEVYVLDSTNSAVLLSRRAAVAAPIASITKLITSLVVLDAKQPLDEILTITADDRAVGRGAFSRLAVGTRLTRGDLMHLALMSSENRAARALGRNFPGGMPMFVRAMNLKAKTLGMRSARFVDPAGLSFENVASAEDLSKLVIAASQNPIIKAYSTDADHTVRVQRRLVRFVNTDSLVKKPSWNIVVQKTGYITEAGECLVMQTVIEDRKIVIVLLNSFGKYTRTADAIRIKKWMQSGGSSRLAYNR